MVYLLMRPISIQNNCLTGGLLFWPLMLDANAQKQLLGEILFWKREAWRKESLNPHMLPSTNTDLKAPWEREKDWVGVTMEK